MATDGETPATKADLSTIEASLLKWTLGIVRSVAGVQTVISIAVPRFPG